jgi:23S rRNA pseudouridine2605 synthase
MNVKGPRSHGRNAGTTAQPRSSRKGGDQVSLERALSKLGFASRSEARQQIILGTTRINGRLCRNPHAWVDPRNDRISVAGVPVRPSRHVTLLLHKPPGIVTSRSDERGRKTVFTLLPRDLPYLFPVGRLDRESSGALLLTNDTRLGNLLTSPDSHVEKEYRVTLDRPLDLPTLTSFQNGTRLASGERLRPVRVTRLPGATPVYGFVLTEGKNRQIRKMCEEAGYSVQGLRRIRIGPVSLGPLAPGKCRFLGEKEVASLLSHAAKGKPHA